MHAIATANAQAAYSNADYSVDFDAPATHIRVMQNARINIVVTKPQRVWLEREAKRLGIKIGEVIRRILDEVREPK